MAEPAPIDGERFELTVAGTTIVGDRLEGTGPGYLYLHGHTSSRLRPRGAHVFAHAAATGHRAARIDFRGHGESGGDPANTTLSDLIADVEHTIEALASRPILIGSSLGGLVAAWFACRHPDSIQGLALLAPALGFTRAAAASIDPATGEPTALQQTGGASIPVSPLVARDALQYDDNRLPERLTMPLAIVHGDRDEVVPAQRSVELHRAVPGTDKTLWLLEGADHSLDTLDAAGDPIRQMPAILRWIDEKLSQR